MIRGLLLAAGRGKRFGADKLMQPLADGRPVALAAAQTLITELPGAIAVCRPQQRLLIEQLIELGFKVETCDQADLGMGYSLATAVAACGAGDDLLVALADMPYVTPETLRKLTAALQTGAQLVRPVYDDRPGNPVGINHRFRQQLLQPTGDEGARVLLRRHKNSTQLIAVNDPGVVLDIDRPEDLITPPGSS
jgi:molybdenum cofactor cytidylyltransferase